MNHSFEPYLVVAFDISVTVNLARSGSKTHVKVPITFDEARFRASFVARALLPNGAVGAIITAGSIGESLSVIVG